MLHAIIMAGGSGTRLWPESRKNRPKQLLRFGQNRSLLQQTVDRLSPAVAPENIRIVTGEHLAEAIREQVPELPEGAIVVEPCARNTSACIALAALLCSEYDENATMVILPSDQAISTNTQFQETLEQAAAYVERYPDKLVTLGITPTYPAESFGYIERGKPIALDGATIPAWQVQQFREKPSREVAAGYLEKGSFYWNAGIFVWKARTILKQFWKYTPNISEIVEHLAIMLMKSPSSSEAFQKILAETFPEFPSISVDYAVMEPAAAAGDVLVMAAPFQWDDIGSWRAMERLFPKDEAENTVLSDGCRTLLLGAEGNIVRCSDKGKVVAAFGVEDLVILVTPDVVLVFDKHREESVRELTKKLKELGWEDLL